MVVYKIKIQVMIFHNIKILLKSIVVNILNKATVSR